MALLFFALSTEVLLTRWLLATEKASSRLVQLMTGATIVDRPRRVSPQGRPAARPVSFLYGVGRRARPLFYGVNL